MNNFYLQIFAVVIVIILLLAWYARSGTPRKRKEELKTQSRTKKIFEKIYDDMCNAVNYKTYVRKLGSLARPEEYVMLYQMHKSGNDLDESDYADCIENIYKIK